MSGTGSPRGIRKPYRVAQSTDLPGAVLIGGSWSHGRSATRRRRQSDSGRGCRSRPDPMAAGKGARSPGWRRWPLWPPWPPSWVTWFLWSGPRCSPSWAALGSPSSAHRRYGRAPGLNFAAKTVLKASIVVLGTGLSFHEVLTIGGASMPVLLGTLAVALHRSGRVRTGARGVTGPADADRGRDRHLRSLGHRRNRRGHLRLGCRRLLRHRHHLHLQRGRRADFPDHRPCPGPLTPRFRTVGRNRGQRPLVGRRRSDDLRAWSHVLRGGGEADPHAHDRPDRPGPVGVACPGGAVACTGQRIRWCDRGHATSCRVFIGWFLVAVALNTIGLVPRSWHQALSAMAAA